MSIAPKITCPNCGPGFAGMAAQVGDVVRCTECKAPLEFIKIAAKVEPDGIKVWVVYDTTYEEPVSVFSTEEKAQSECRRLEGIKLEQGYNATDAAIWYQYEGIELNKPAEVVDIT